MTTIPLPPPVLFGLDRAAFDVLNTLRNSQEQTVAFDALPDGADNADALDAARTVAARHAWRAQFADEVDRYTSGTDALGGPIEAPYAAVVVVHHTGGVEVAARSYWLARDPWWLSTIGQVERVDDGLEIVTYLLTGHAA